MARKRRILWLWGLSFALGLAGACSLNPQPIPPGDQFDASVPANGSKGSDAGGGGGFDGSEAGIGSGVDGGDEDASPSDDAGDAGEDAGDASDDAGDAG